MEDAIQKMKSVLQKARTVKSKLELLRKCVNNGVYCGDCDKKNQIANLEALAKMIDCCLDILSDDERIIVEMHLVGGHDWGQVTAAYKTVRGSECEKTERTLKSYQKRALVKIANFTTKHHEFGEILDTFFS